MFQFGIEHEVAFLNQEEKFADFSCTSFAQFNQIIEALPTYAEDYTALRIGDAGIKKKRWYIEGFERFQDSEKVIDCLPKGIEIRTTVHSGIDGAIAELSDSFSLLRKVAAQFGFTPVLISFNPFHTEFAPNPPLTEYEIQRRQASPEKQTANIPMLTYGPDLNLSFAGLTTAQLIDIGRKLTFYSPYVIPFSFSSPFRGCDRWHGLSARTFERTGARPATMVFLERQEDLIKSNPSLTKIARLSAEVGRIEFKAFDSCDDFKLYGALLALLKGLVLDQSLLGRATVPDQNLHQRSAIAGFDDPHIVLNATQVLDAVEIALSRDRDLEKVGLLRTMLETGRTRAHQLIHAFTRLGSIEDALKQSYLDK
ncbi:glutamate--cysteine ligase [Leptolyngbya sp. AN03gr2]|uniref:glutamate--cysteine ligase n=1 Tax=unclassified Leptolyngbya TaxID=2650499 RepID=UPI003D31723C